MTSLRSRLLLWLLPATFLAAAGASVGSVWGAAVSLADLLDDQLRYVAGHVGTNAARVTVDTTNEPRRHLGDDHADDVLTEVWQGDRLVFASGPRAGLPPPGPTGLRTVVAAGQEWHTYVLRQGDRAVRVAQARDARWEALTRIAIRLLWPILALLPVLGVCLWFGIGYGLRPLRQIATEISRRDAGSWQPIRPRPLPGEVRPLVDALNDMLLRLERAFGAQSDFIADASHELRTPAMALGVHVELARSARSLEEREAALQQVQRGVERLDRLAHQLLSLARVSPEAGIVVRQRVDLAAVCREVIVDELPQADRRRQVLGLDAFGCCEVLGDPVKLQLLLRNLIDNAIRYSPMQSRVDVCVRQVDRGVVLVVEDDGPGISAAERPRVLDRFYRGADPGQTGSGLGLAIVKRIADEHRATLGLGDGAAGRGLRVSVAFANEAPASGGIASRRRE